MQSLKLHVNWFIVVRGTTAVQMYNVKAARSMIYSLKYCSITGGLDLTRMMQSNNVTTKLLTLWVICAATLNQVQVTARVSDIIANYDFMSGAAAQCHTANVEVMSIANSDDRRQLYAIQCCITIEFDENDEEIQLSHQTLW